MAILVTQTKVKKICSEHRHLPKVEGKGKCSEAVILQLKASTVCSLSC